jgi:hypothetical protein
MFVKRGAMHHSPLTDVRDGDLREIPLGELRHERFPEELVSASNP